MTRRILVGAAVAASSLAVGVAASSAKAHHHNPKPTKPSKPAPKPTSFSSNCKLSLSVAVPAGQSSVEADAQSGTMYGPSSCTGVGAGVVSFPFSVANSGDIVGNSTAYYATGSVTGAVDLSETSSAPPTPYAFGNTDLAGTLKITKGTGSFAGVKGSGTFACTTSDSIHYSCTLKVKGILPPAGA